MVNFRLWLHSEELDFCDHMDICIRTCTPVRQYIQVIYHVLLISCESMRQRYNINKRLSCRKLGIFNKVFNYMSMASLVASHNAVCMSFAPRFRNNFTKLKCPPDDALAKALFQRQAPYTINNPQDTYCPVQLLFHALIHVISKFDEIMNLHNVQS